MTVRDDRGDVKQTTTGFRGPLMVQSLTSAKSKFLSLLLPGSCPLGYIRCHGSLSGPKPDYLVPDDNMWVRKEIQDARPHRIVCL